MIKQFQFLSNLILANWKRSGKILIFFGVYDTFSLQYFAWLEFVIFFVFKQSKWIGKELICQSAPVTLGPVPRKMVTFNPGLSQILSKHATRAYKIL